MPLGKEFFNRPAKKLAKALLGKRLVFGSLSGIIVETEAYLSKNDPGCHANRGMTKRNAPMFGPSGYAYVYLIYGMYHCLNFVSGKTGDGEAVLIRALQPVNGIDIMKKRRKTTKLINLCSGPGKLTEAFGITQKHNQLSLIKGPIQIYENKNETKPKIITTARIGLTAGKELKLRFYLKNNIFVSKLNSQR